MPVVAAEVVVVLELIARIEEHVEGIVQVVRIERRRPIVPDGTDIVEVAVTATARRGQEDAVSILIADEF